MNPLENMTWQERFTEALKALIAMEMEKDSLLRQIDELNDHWEGIWTKAFRHMRKVRYASKRKLS